MARQQVPAFNLREIVGHSWVRKGQVDILSSLLRITSVVLATAAVVLKTINTVGESIECLCPPQHSAAQCNYTKAWCRISPVLFIDYDTEIPHDPTQRQNASRQKMDGYPMVPLVLILLAFCLGFPSIMWQMEEEQVEMIAEWPVVSSDLQKRAARQSSADSLSWDNSKTGTHENVSKVMENVEDEPACKYRKKHFSQCSYETDSPASRSKERQYASLTQPRTFLSEKCNVGQKEMLAQARLARWWRRNCQQLASLKFSAGVLPNTTNPNTLLFHVARSSEGKEFLQEESKQLKKCLGKGERTADLMAALGSVEEWLQHSEDAVNYFTEAVRMEPENKEWQWHLQKALKQQSVNFQQLQLLPMPETIRTFPQPTQVERVSCKNLSFHDFFMKYALRHVPVIITDMVPTITTVPWDLQHIKDVAGNCEVKVKRSVPGSVEWAGLEESGNVKVAEFIENLHNHQDYLFDWSLPLYCPQLAKELTIPKYFAGDFLQRTAPGTLYKDSWPSLFIAPSGISSGLHVDAFASNFWMALFQGKKKWIFFQEEDTPCLYPVYSHSLDPTFLASVVNPDMVNHPLLSLVHPVECILNAGEILFVPGGSPHYVENLETTLAISGNFVDLSNWRRVLSELEVNGLTDPRAADLARQFRQPTFVSNMNSCISDLPWFSFKTWPRQPSDISMMDISEQNLDFLHQKS